MEANRHNGLRVILVVVSVIWIAATIWIAFVNAPPDAFLTKESPEVLDRMDRECVGSYQQRYDCKNSIAIEASNHAFWEGAIRFTMVLIGPLLAGAYFGWVVAKQPPPVSHPIKHDDMEWKKSAQKHVARLDDEDDF